MKSPNIPILNLPCGCNCFENEQLAAISARRMDVWQMEIEQMQSHGYIQVHRKGWMPKDDFLEVHLKAARELSLSRVAVFEDEIQRLKAACCLYDHWGCLVEDEFQHLLGYAVRLHERSRGR